MVLRAGAWGLLAIFLLFSAYLLWWAILALTILGELPASDDVLRTVIPAVVVVTSVIAALVARFVSSPRRVATATLVVLATLWGAELVWALVAPDRALYTARAVAWGESDVLDYQKFPQRTIENVAPAFVFPTSASPFPIATVEYESDGVPKQADLEAFLEATHTTSFIVIKDGQIRYEGYFNGYSRDSVVTSFSIAKSFMSALTGIAIQEGYVQSVDDKVVAYIPELKDKGLDEMTIRHLLTMSSGVRYITDDEASLIQTLTLQSEQTHAYYHPNLRARALEVTADGTIPGSRYKYNDYLPQLIGIILERTTQRPVSQYLEEKIWKPLGMDFPASWSLDSNKYGFEQMQSGINGRAIDFAKFGQLFLNEGLWRGQQVISAAWVQESTSPDPNDHRPWDLDGEGWKDAGRYYKYFWWGIPNGDGTYDYVARGHLGQKIYVSPQDNTVIVRFGTEDGIEKWEDVFRHMIAALR
jgi:CubicO group peptidase (beta-lactamase class C family)